MAMKLNMMRVRKELLINRVQRQVSNNKLVVVGSMGNLSQAQKYEMRYGLEDIGASVNFTKNTLVGKGLEVLGPEAQRFAPLLRGRTVLACGPAEVPLAKHLLSLEKKMPGFHLLGALLDSQRILQVDEIDRLAKLPPLEEMQSQMVSAMMPGTALQVPNVAAYLVNVLQMRVDAMRDGDGDGDGAA